MRGSHIQSTKLLQGSTLAIINTDILYSGTYFIEILSDKKILKTFKIIIQR